jgi:hypothetical protein
VLGSDITLRASLAARTEWGLSPSYGFAGLFAAVLRQYRREAAATQQNAEGVIALSAEHGLSDYLAFATTMRGWAMAK